MIKLPLHTPINFKLFSVIIVGAETAGSIKGDEEFEFTDPAGARLGTGEIVTCWSGRLCELPASMLEKHHDPAQRTYSGMCLVMKMLHPEAITNDEAIVSCMTFHATGGEIVGYRPKLVKP